MPVSREDVLCTLHLWCYLILIFLIWFMLKYKHFITWVEAPLFIIQYAFVECLLEKKFVNVPSFYPKFQAQGQSNNQIKLKVVRNFVSFV